MKMQVMIFAKVNPMQKTSNSWILPCEANIPKMKTLYVLK